MNNDRRKRLSSVSDAISAAVTELETAIEALTEIRDEEQEAYDNMPPSLQDSERGQASEEAYSTMDEVIDLVQSFVDETPQDMVLEAAQ